MGPNSKAFVYTLQDGAWTLSNNQVTVQEGWYLVPPAFVQENKPLKPSDND